MWLLGDRAALADDVEESPAGARKDGCGWMLRERLWRPDVDLWRRLVRWRGRRGSRDVVLPDVEERQHCDAGLLSSRTSMI